MRVINSHSGAKMIIDGRKITNFTGCSYLGISDQKELLAAAISALETYGSVGQIPRHYNFLAPPYSEAEQAAIEFFDTEAAVFFSAGYLFASMALQGLAPEYDVIFMDEKAHYSVCDGAATANKPVYRFKHTDPDDLARVVSANLKTGQIPLVATDGMFPTYGNLAPLDKYYEIINQHRGWMIVDESHSFGAIGERGRGAIEKFDLPRERVIGGGSMAKAFCAYGAIAVGSRLAIDAILSSPPAKGATAGMTAAAAMTAASLSYVKKHPELLARLRENTKYLKEGLLALGIDVELNDSPAATFTLGTAAEMKKVQAVLMENGICIIYSQYVGAGPEGVLRCSIFADHTKEDLDLLLNSLKHYL